MAAGRRSLELVDTALVAACGFMKAGAVALKRFEHLWQSILTALEQVNGLLVQTWNGNELEIEVKYCLEIQSTLVVVVMMSPHWLLKWVPRYL